MISIAKDFSDVPWGRVPADGDYCGQNFRENLLLPALRNNSGKITVTLDGLEGLGSSFLEEAFGGLVRHGYFNASDLQSRLDVVTTQPEFHIYRELIWNYVRSAVFASEKRLEPTG